MARIVNGISAFTPEEFGISTKDLKWYIDKCTELAVEHHGKGGSSENADILKLLSEAFDSLVMSDANFRHMILTLANIQMLQITSLNSAIAKKVVEELLKDDEESKEFH